MRSFARRLSVCVVLALLAPASTAEPQTKKAAPPARVTAVRRESLPDLVRVIVQLDREVLFREGRLDGPPRVYLDLTNAAAVAALRNRAFAFDGDVVRHVRLGRPATGVTRVVLDLDGAGSYSVYPLYNPFRLVIDVERAKTTPGTPQTRSASSAGLPDLAPPAKPVRSAQGAGSVSRTPPPPARRPVVPAPPVPRGIPPAARPSPPTRSAAATGDLAPVLAPDATSGASWQPEPLPAQVIQTAVTSSVAGTAPERPRSTSTAGATARTASAAETPPSPPSRNAAGRYSLSRQLGLGISRVVIDAGHGGHDPGARVKGLNEADLVLDVALRLEKLLKAQPGVEVVLTRRTNVYIPLEERTALANREDADLFLSIHANASENPKARGLETYYLNFAPNPDAERIAARENAGSARTMRALPDIVKAIALNNKIDESRDFAGQVQASLVAGLRRSNRNTRDLGVKQAPFMVLIGATMPSVLAEISFITNDDEGRLLKTARYRQHIAEALFQGIQKYQRGLKAGVRLASQ